MTTIALPRPRNTLLDRLRTIQIGIGARGAVGVGLATQRGGATILWYLAGGAPTPIAVYQPKGAASLASSYVNLANPGAYDAAPGVAPTFNAATGWAFNGSSQYLVTIVPNSGYSYLIRYSNGSLINSIIGGMYDSGSPNARADLRPYWTGPRLYLYGNSLSLGGAALAAGVMGLAGNQGYFDGSPDGTGAGVWSGTSARPMFIGALNNSGLPAFYWSGNIQAVAIWNTSTNYAVWMPAVMAAAAAL